MPKEISDDEFTEFQNLRSSSVAMELDLAKANFKATNPHVPGALVDAFQGDPASVEAFGKALLTQFPVPSAPVAPAPPQAQVTPPVASAQPGQQPPAAAPAQPVAPAIPPAPIPGASSPIMATQFQPPVSSEQLTRLYNQQLANGGVVQTPEQLAAAGGIPAPVPQPGTASALQAPDAVAQQSEVIRERMRIGVARPEEVRWLAQYGEKGFVAAVTTHGRKVAAVMGTSRS